MIAIKKTFIAIQHNMCYGLFMVIVFMINRNKMTYKTNLLLLGSFLPSSSTQLRPNTLFEYDLQLPAS